MRQAHDRILAAGAAVAFIACQDPYEAVTYFARAPERPSFPVLIDADRAVAKAYRVHAFYSGRRFRVARPASFLIGADRRILFRGVGERPEDRVPIERLLAIATRGGA